MEEYLSSLSSWLVAAAAGGIVESFSGDKFFGNLNQLRENLRQYKPDQNHEIQQAVLSAYLQATLQLCVVYSEEKGFDVQPYLIDLLPRIVGKAKVLKHIATSNKPLPENAEELFRHEYRASSSFIERFRNKLLGAAPTRLQLDQPRQSEKEWLERVVKEYGELLIQLSQKKLNFPDEIDNRALNALLDEKSLLMQTKNAQERENVISGLLISQVESELVNKFGEMSEDFKIFLAANWFNYFCGCFQYQLSRNTELARKFQSKILAKIEVDTDRIIKSLDKFKTDFSERLKGVEENLAWLGKEQKEEIAELKQLIRSFLPVFSIVGKAETSHEFIIEIKKEFRLIVDEINAFTEQDGDKTRHALTEAKDEIIEKLEENKPRPLPSSIPTPKGFIGRENELAELQKAKDAGKTAFVLHGAGGVGKTDLSMEFIRRNKAGYEADIRIDMQGLSSNPLPPKDAMLEVIRAFAPGVPADLSPQDVNNLYTSLLNQYKTILFFDNAKDRAQVEPLNNAAALIVVTSRTSFNVTGGFSTETEKMVSEDARALLYSITDEQRFDDQADALAYLAGYLPMALLPLAALLAEDVTLEAKDLVQKYSDRKEALQLADPNRENLADPNHENLSVEASFDLSYELLSEESKERWRKLAVFLADFDLDAMQSVWEIEDGKKTLSELVKKHLLEFDKKTRRSRLHDLARVYGINKLSDEESAQVLFAHCVHYGRLLASLQQATLPNLDKFDLERTNIENGFAWLTNKIELDETFAQICGLYVGYSPRILLLRLHFREYIKWLETGLKASQNLDNRQQIGADLGNLGIAYSSLGEYKKAIEYHERALTISKEIGDRQGEGSDLGSLGNAYSSLGEYKKAIALYEQALTISKEIGDRESEGNSLGNLGIAYRNLGEYKKAIEFYEQALAIAREIGDRQGEGNQLGNLGIAYRNLGEYKKAIEFYEQALAIAREIGDRQGEGDRLGSLGNAYFSLGEYKKAIEFYEQALAIAREIGDRQGEGNQLGNLGSIYSSLREYRKAKDYYIRSLSILEAIESPQAEIARQNLTLLENEM